MNKPKVFLISTVLLSMILLSGCGLTLKNEDQAMQLTLAMAYAQSTLDKIALETQIANLQTPILPTETLAPEPSATSTQLPTVALPTLTPLPSATNTTAAPTVPEIRMEFIPNATNVAVMGSVPAYATLRYVFRAFAGQLVDITLTSAQASAISVSGRDGTVLLSPMGESKSFRGYLPSTQDWFIDIRAAGTVANFGLYLMIPERITFAAGTHEITMPDNVPAGGVHNYIAYALAGQTMFVSATPSGDVALSIWGIDGTVMMSSMGESNTFSGTLPISQDWIINVRSAPGTGTRYFTFWMDIH